MKTEDGIPNDSSDSEMEDRTTANLATLKLDEWLNFKLEPEVSCFIICDKCLSSSWYELIYNMVKIISLILSSYY